MTFTADHLKSNNQLPSDQVGAVLSIVYGAFHLNAIRFACAAAVILSSLLVIKGVSVVSRTS